MSGSFKLESVDCPWCGEKIRYTQPLLKTLGEYVEVFYPHEQQLIDRVRDEILIKEQLGW